MYLGNSSIAVFASAPESQKTFLKNPMPATKLVAEKEIARNAMACAELSSWIRVGGKQK